MNHKEEAAQVKDQVKKGSSQLLAAALAGLMGASLAGCGKDDDKKSEEPTEQNSNAAKPTVTSKKNVADLTFNTFATDCKTRAGLVQTHASCAGVNSCKGMSFNKWSKDLIEHTCKGANTCAGMSCVDLPADSGKNGESVFKENCAYCHSTAGHSLVDETPGFKVYYPKGGNGDVAIAAFKERSTTTHVAIVAFGIAGVHKNGTAYSHMPTYYSKISRAEIEKVVDYVRTLTPQAEEFEILGQE